MALPVLYFPVQHGAEEGGAWGFKLQVSFGNESFSLLSGESLASLHQILSIVLIVRSLL